MEIKVDKQALLEFWKATGMEGYDKDFKKKWAATNVIPNYLILDTPFMSDLNPSKEDEILEENEDYISIRLSPDSSEINCQECGSNYIKVEFSGTAEISNVDGKEVTTGIVKTHPVEFYCVDCGNKWDIDKNYIIKY